MNDLYKEWTGKDLSKSIVTTNLQLIVAEDDQKEGGGKIVGALQAKIICDAVWDERWVLIENVYVKKEYRRQGIAKGLMQFAEAKFLLTKEFAFIKLTSRKKGGKAVYRSLGYEEGAAFRKGL